MPSPAALKASNRVRQGDKNAKLRLDSDRNLIPLTLAIASVLTTHRLRST